MAFFFENAICKYEVQGFGILDPEVNTGGMPVQGTTLPRVTNAGDCESAQLPVKHEVMY